MSKKIGPAPVVMLVVGLCLLAIVTSADNSPSDGEQHRPGRQAEVELCTLTGIRENIPAFVPPPLDFDPDLQGGRLVRPHISVNYTAFPAEAQAAFEYALRIWESQLSSDANIVIDAQMTPLPSGTLARAGASAYRDFSGAPLPNTWFDVPLANKLYGADLNPDTVEISAEFNSDLSGALGWWYYGTDGAPPLFHYDFVSTALHELAHGLNFGGTAFVNKRTGIGYYGSGAPPFPSIYDRFVVNGSLQPILSFASGTATLAAQLQGRSLYWSGPYGLAARGTYPRLYAPSDWNSGSSYSHLNEASYPPGNPDTLMTPQAAWQEASHNPGAITMGMLRDMGWDDTSCNVDVYPTTVSVPAAGGEVSVQVSTPLPGCPWSPVNPLGYAWFQLPSGTGRGSMALTFTVSANTQTARTGWFTVGGKRVDVSQATLYTVPVVTVQPQNRTVTAGQSASFTATASGTPTPTVRWQVSSNGGSTWTTISGATSTTYTFTTTTADNGKRYRSLFTNELGTATTNAATLTVSTVTVNTAPAVTTHPASVTVTAGQTASFTAAATGSPTPTIRWHVSFDSGNTWFAIVGQTANTYSFTPSVRDSGTRYRAVFSNISGTTTSNVAILTVNSLPASQLPVVTTHPASTTVTAGEAVTFTAAANGTPTPTIRWDVSVNGGASWATLTMATASTYSFTPTVAESGRRFRAVFTNSVGSATTNVALLTVNALSVTTVPGAPSGVSAAAGIAEATVTFTPPSSDGGAAITRYTVTASPGGATATGTGSPITVIGLTGGTAYTFAVTASNSVGTGSASAASAAVTVLSIPAGMPGPPSLSPAIVSGNSVSLSWRAGAGTAPTSYTLVAGSTPGGSDVGVFPLGGSTAVAAAAPDGLYYVRVRANTAVGTALSNEISITVGAPCEAASAPLNVAATRSGSLITVSWQAPLVGTGPIAYTIVAGSSAGLSNVGTFPVGSVLAVSATAPPGSYFIRVRATAACAAASAESAEVAVVVP